MRITLLRHWKNYKPGHSLNLHVMVAEHLIKTGIAEPDAKPVSVKARKPRNKAMSAADRGPENGAE